MDAPDVRVCVVQGPSGSGKTTLLRNWTRCSAQASRTWVSLSAAINTRQAFWHHLLNSATRLGDVDEADAAAIREQLSVASDPVRLASNLIAEAGPVVIVLDAYENLGDAQGAVDADLARLVRVAPDLRLVITTRARTTLMDLVLPDGIVRVISLSELALTADEVADLIAMRTGIHDHALSASVAAATRGFALTVQAVVLVLAQLGSVPHLESREWSTVLATRLESLLPDQVAVQFVTDTSVPPYVDAELAARLGGSDDGVGDASRMFDMLERNGFGRWIPYSRHHSVFQYVDTIRDSFRAKAEEDADRFRRLCTTTALWLLENEEVVDQALQFAIDAGDYALADRVFVSVVITNPDSYITDRFLGALSRVPEELLGDHPMLAFGLALALAGNLNRRGESPRVAELAVASTARPAYLEPSLDAFVVDSMQAIARRLALRFRDSSDASLRVIGTLDAIAPEILEVFGEHVGTILRQLSYSLWQGGRIGEAMAAVNRSVALCPDQKTRNCSIVYAAGISAFAGETTRAAAFAASVDAVAWPTALRQSFMNGPGVIAEGYARLDALDFFGAIEVLKDAGTYLETAEFWAFFAGVALAARHGAGQAQAEAERVSRELAATVPRPGIGDNVATQRLHAVLAFAWLACGDVRAATDALVAQPADSPYVAAARIAVLMATERDKNAFAAARSLLDLPGHTVRTLAETHTLGAVAALRCGDTEAAWSWLTAAALAWESYGPRVHVALLPSRFRQQLREFAGLRQVPLIQRYLDVPAPLAPQALHAANVLSPRERIVLGELVTHGSARAIAEALVVSPHTVKTQLQSIYRKLGVTSRASALVAARELGLLGETEPQAPAVGDQHR
ncbi:LuxR C-terminal-related transcriptional regulator [Microbacterium sp.]|uniref:LuxR C-terminal-related transcriptional regulator n=1 Tax=Microbacterium sp. TaxID=51671 RepID=UPI0039E702F2